MKVKSALSITFAFIVSACQTTTVDRGDFGHMFRSLNNTAYGYQILKNPQTGQIVERFEVRDGDCAANNGWSDCTNDRERSELSEQNKSTTGGEYEYGWEFYIPNDYPNIYPTKTALGQFHQSGPKPAWMFQNYVGGLWIDNQITTEYTKLINKEDFRGKWHQIKVKVKWSRKDDGYMKIWANGEHKLNYTGSTFEGDYVYFKYGVYRSFLSRYQKSKNIDNPDSVIVPTQIVKYRNVFRKRL